MFVRPRCCGKGIFGKQYLAAEGPHSLIVAGVLSDTCTVFARPLFPVLKLPRLSVRRATDRIVEFESHVEEDDDVR